LVTEESREAKLSKRSRNMAAIRSKNTKPELVVRSLVHRLGFRFRLYAKDLPGRPDLVFRSRKKVIFVNGCFWHQHSSAKCLDGRIPKSNRSYWKPKLLKNAERDKRNLTALKSLKWKVLIVWECETNNQDRLVRTLTKFL
jgi:DNA mismatch endonuclease, patch repair protein